MLKTIKQPYYLVVVDNASTDGTQDWLIRQFDEQKVNQLVLNTKNNYPGRACNQGWEEGLINFPDADYLMRTDNDMDFIDGWYSKWPKYFNRIHNLAQLGLDYSLAKEAPENMIIDWQPLTLQDETYKSFCRVKTKGLELIPWPGSIGGTCIIRRKVWDIGIRYDETPWHHIDGQRVTPQEDAKFSTAILRAGWTFAHAGERLSEHFGGPTPETLKKYPEYYKETLIARDIGGDWREHV